ncbi:MAG: hypothetical protein KGN77_08865 [Xanthomonadaceae bacterium]|nr:hypothetical protein [Xanthomonadaceae bacterium]MDE1964118.1 hypothetical protein [Xanthomonadaceae bacterium]
MAKVTFHGTVNPKDGSHDGESRVAGVRPSHNPSRHGDEGGAPNAITNPPVEPSYGGDTSSKPVMPGDFDEFRNDPSDPDYVQLPSPDECSGVRAFYAAVDRKVAEIRAARGREQTPKTGSEDLNREAASEDSVGTNDFDHPWRSVGTWWGAVDYGTYYVKLIGPGRWRFYAKVSSHIDQDEFEDMSVVRLLSYLADLDDGHDKLVRAFKRIIRSEGDEMSLEAIRPVRREVSAKIKRVVRIREIGKPLGWRHAIEIETEDGRRGLLRTLPERKRTADARPCTDSTVSLGDTFRVVIDRKVRSEARELLRAHGLQPGFNPE